jgi:hypothetical protein
MVDRICHIAQTRKSEVGAGTRGRMSSTSRISVVSQRRAPLWVRAASRAAAIVIASALIAFLVFTYAGDAAVNMIGPEAAFSEPEVLRHRLGLDRPPPMQFVRYVEDVARAQLGLSVRAQEPVVRLLLKRLPASADVILLAAALVLLLRRLRPLSVIARASVVACVAAAIVAAVAGNVQITRGAVTALGSWSTGLLSSAGLLSASLPAALLAGPVALLRLWRWPWAVAIVWLCVERALRWPGVGTWWVDAFAPLDPPVLAAGIVIGGFGLALGEACLMLRARRAPDLPPPAAPARP